MPSEYQFRETLTLQIERNANGGAWITGSYDSLAVLRAMIWRRLKIDACLVKSYQVDGVDQPGYPRMELHPSNAERILSALSPILVR